ncbi:phage tail fiber protein [Citrobacter sp. FDAARGOS_156]|uniref:phage tail fiber protein n=1 Tax=Citrobacter sp. FDAARGOS_156 TaxID=1702170 RepID=UPI003F8D2EA9
MVSVSIPSTSSSTTTSRRSAASVHASSPSFARNRIGNTDEHGVFTETVTDGEPVDIPTDAFVSVRVQMPSDSIWNRSNDDAMTAMKKTELELEQIQQEPQQ